MNKIVLFLLLIIGINSQGQVAIGKSSVDGDGILDFENTENRGMILPWISSENEVLNPVGGTLIFDVSDKYVKYFNGISWVHLSFRAGTVNTFYQDPLTDIGEGVIIGDNTSSAKGVLVLESNNKALILPKVENVLQNVNNPVAGTIVYDTSTKKVCVYNGLHWTFWGE